jgi:RNA polymerase sigma-70 factor, ECF subfamily
LPAFDSLIMPHLGDLRNFCYSLARSKWDAEDLVQEALLKSLRYYHKTGSGRMTKAFLFTAARNLWIDACRKSSREELLSPVDLRCERQAHDEDCIELREIMEWLLALLPSRTIELWLLSDYFGYSMKEIAELTHSSIPAVKSALFRARRVIRSSKYEIREHAPSRRGCGNIAQLETERLLRAITRGTPIHSFCSQNQTTEASR